MATMVKIFDTTLRDGEQSPGCSMNMQEKIEVAKVLEKLKVDAMEAGFPASSPGDLEAVKAIGGIIKDCVVAGLCRSLPKDIDAAREALIKAASPRIHIFIATSPILYRFRPTNIGTFGKEAAIIYGSSPASLDVNKIRHPSDTIAPCFSANPL